jgi:hypothetical protein
MLHLLLRTVGGTKTKTFLASPSQLMTYTLKHHVVIMLVNPTQQYSTITRQ